MEIQPQYAREETGKISPEHTLRCDVGVLEEMLEDVDFPVTKETLLQRGRDIRLTCGAGDQHTLAELLAPITKDQYNSVQDISDALNHPVRER